MQPMPTLSPHHIVGASQDRCLYCSGPRIVRKGKRRKKLQTVQLWYCKDCDKVFTPHAIRGRTYPIQVILDGLNYYAMGHSLEDSATLLQEHYGVTMTPTTLSSWIKEYRPLCPYARLRQAGKERYSPYRIIQSTRLHHQQVYHYRIHRVKLDSLLTTPSENPSGETVPPLADYLVSMVKGCPHRLFQQEERGSSLKSGFDLDGVAIRERRNMATRIAQFAAQGAMRNRERHDTVQKFMLANDSVTVATEVPVYLLPEDIRHLKSRLGFLIPFADDAIITGHIDVLQIRNGSVHILDYKPNAIRERPIGQLTFYAIALSRRTGLRLYDFTCAWFDQDHYFEFYPLHVVWKKGIR